MRDGDHILAAWGRRLIEQRRLPKKTVVSTVMANLGLEVSLREVGGRLVRTPVGDRFVAQEMLRGGYLLGGEQSGHILFFDGFQTTGDGLLTLAWVLDLMLSTGQPLSRLTACMRKFPQVLVNVRVREKPDLLAIDAVKRRHDEALRALGGDGRVVLRYSGTEPLARVMIEGPSKALVERAARGIAEAIRGAVGEGERE